MERMIILSTNPADWAKLADFIKFPLEIDYSRANLVEWELAVIGPTRTLASLRNNLRRFNPNLIMAPIYPICRIYFCLNWTTDQINTLCYQLSRLAQHDLYIHFGHKSENGRHLYLEGTQTDLAKILKFLKNQEIAVTVQKS